MSFIADDLGAWLVGLLADAGRRKLTAWVLGDDQERVLLQAATAAVQAAAGELRPEGGKAGELAMVVNQVFRVPVPNSSSGVRATLLEALQAEVAGQLAVLDDVGLTGTGHSSAEVLGLPTAVVAERLTSHLVREILARGSRGGPLEPLASQLNHDMTHLQGRRLEGMVGQLAGEFREFLARRDKGQESEPDSGKVVWGPKSSLSGERPELRQPGGPISLDQVPYLNEKRDGFVGREWLFSLVNVWLRTVRSESALLITGEPGIGKSAFIAELAHRNPDGRVVAYHFCTREDRLTLEPGAFVSNLAAMLASRLPSFAPLLADGRLQSALREARSYPGQALDQAIIAPLARMPAPIDGTRLILLDALDEAMFAAPDSEAADDANIVSLLASRLDRLPPWLRVIATARSERRTAQELASLRAAVVDAQIDENVHDLTQFIDSQIRAGLRVADPAMVVHEIARISNGNFLYAKSLLRGLERDQIPVDSLGSLPPSMAGFYGRQFHRLLSTTRAELARPVLEVLVAAQAPLDIAVITSAAAMDRHETTNLLNRLSEFVKDRGGGLVLFHRSLADWLVDPRSSFSVDPRRGHERLAAEYVAVLDIGPQPKERPANTSAVAYRGRYGLDHLAQAGLAVSRDWNPWIFAATALSAKETGHALGSETEFVPVFAQRYVAAALLAGDLTRIADLVLLIAKAARVCYHDAGVIRINVAADGTWTQEITGEAYDGSSLSGALTLSGWAGGIISAAVTAHPDRTKKLGPAIVALDGLGYLARGLDIAGWAYHHFGRSSFEDRGNCLGRELAALARTNEPWQPDEDARLRELIGQGETSVPWDLGRSPAAVRRRAAQLNLTMPSQSR